MTDTGQACCDVHAVESGQRRALNIALVVNATMFLIEFGAGLLGHSTALLADSLDMLGDALVYGFSLYVVGRGPRWLARGALLKGSVMAVFAAGVAGEAVFKLLHGALPDARVMGLLGLLALAANTSCLLLLRRHRRDDINMRSAWVCSRNDVLANLGVLVAAAGVAITGAGWPDIAVGTLIAFLIAASAWRVMRQALRQLRTPLAQVSGG